MKNQAVLFSLSLALLFAGVLEAQLDLLTLREAESLVERIPEVVAAEKSGGCPSASPGYWSAEELAFQVRFSCGPNSGMLLNDYNVDRRTGEVTLFGDDPRPVASPEGKALADRLVRQARARALSGAEAGCLAREAANGVPGWKDAKASITVKPFPVPLKVPGALYFMAGRSDTDRPIESGRMLTVDLSTARVRNDYTGQDIISEGLGRLASKIVALRAPRLLSDEDALSIALLIPSVAARLKPGCLLKNGGVSRSREAIIGLECEGRDVGQAISVDLLTGQAKEANSGKILESSKAKEAARSLLDKFDEQQSQLRKEVDAACPP